MKIKKLLALALAGVMTATMLVGCGDGGSGNGGNGGNGGVSEDGTVTINVTRALFNRGAVDTAQVQKVEDKINEYIKGRINVQIKLTEVLSADYKTKVPLSLASNEINLLWTASWQEAVGTNDLVPQNAVYDITDLLPGTALYSSMDAGQWEATKYNGKNYFIPVYKDNVEGYDLMFRKELVDKYNWDLSTVKELKDIEPFLVDAKAEGLKYPYLTQKGGMFYRYYLDSFDFFTGNGNANWVAVDRESNSVVDTILTDEYLDFCKLMAKWGEAGYISEDEVAKVTPETTTQTQDWGISWWTDIPVNAEANSRYNQEVVMVPLTSRWAHSTSALGSCYAITASSSEAQAKACIDFMGLLYTDKYLADLYTFGIEGEDYNYNGDGLVEVVENSKYNHGMWESASATIVTPEYTEPANKAELYKDFNSSANTSCAAGFRFDRGPVETQFAACVNVYDQYGHPLENGGIAEADVEKTIDAYQAALNEAGYQDVLAEFQKQYDAWKAGN